MVSSTYSLARSTASGSMSIAERTACSASSEYGGRRSEYGSRASGAIENSTGELDIFPSGAFPRRIPQQSGGVVCDDDRNAVVAMHLSTELSDRRLCVQKSLGRKGAECKDYFRLDELELPNEVRSASQYLIGSRVAVAGGPVFHDVRDEDVVPRQIDGCENLGEELPCLSDERQSLLVFIQIGRAS